MRFIIPVIKDLSSAICGFPAPLRGEFTQGARVKGSEQPPLTTPLFPTVFISWFSFAYLDVIWYNFAGISAFGCMESPFPSAGSSAEKAGFSTKTDLTQTSWTPSFCIFFFACQGGGKQWQSLGSRAEASGRAVAKRHLGTAAWKAAGGSREQHNCPETSPEAHNRWGGALSHSHVPCFTSVLNRQRQHPGSICQTQPGAWPCTWWWTLLRPRSKAGGKILASLKSRGFSHRSEWDQGFCSVFPWDNSRKKKKAFPCSVLPPGPELPLHSCLRDSAEG